MTDVSLPASILLLIFGFSFVVFILIYIYLCENQSRSDLPFLDRLGLSRSDHRGLDSDMIASFPTFTYSAFKGLKIEKGSLECSVCLFEFQDDDKLRLLPQCNHTFHPECIDEWLSSHITCPVCRANLREDSGAAVAEAVVVDILGEANDPRSDRHEDVGRFGMLNHVAAGSSDEEPNSNVVPSAGVAIVVPVEEHFDEERSETVDVVHQAPES